MDFRQRKPNRIADFDYSGGGAYFVTICTQERQKILSEIVGDDAHIVPKPYGMIVEKYIRRVPEVKKYVIMPDHLHMIIRLDGDNRQNKQVSSIVRSIKTLTTKEVGTSIFQRSYYDHVIRNQQDYNEIWEYIEENPMKWIKKTQGLD